MFTITNHQRNTNRNLSEILLHTYQDGYNQALTRMWRDWNSHMLLMGMPNGAATLEKSLAVPPKGKHRITITDNNSTPRYILKRIENICPNKSLYTNVQSSMIQSSQKVGRNIHHSNGHQLMPGSTKKFV